MQQILMTRDNPNGAKLEELLDKLCEEIQTKSDTVTANVKTDKDRDAAVIICQRNFDIIEHLKAAAIVQRGTLDLVEKSYGPDKGPEIRDCKMELHS